MSLAVLQAVTLTCAGCAPSVASRGESLAQSRILSSPVQLGSGCPATLQGLGAQPATFYLILCCLEASSPSCPAPKAKCKAHSSLDILLFHLQKASKVLAADAQCRGLLFRAELLLFSCVC